MLKPLFKFFQRLEKTFGVKVHFIETGIVLLILSATAVLSGKGWVEWVGVFGVVFTFEYQVLSTYLAEHGEARKRIGKHTKSDFVYKEIQFLYYTKEIVWISYFLLLGAYSAIVGTIVFISYGIWRRLYRNEYPLLGEDII